MQENKLSIRPILPAAEVRSDMSQTEQFQNKTLRPILKMQHDLFILVFKTYLDAKKRVYFKLSPPQQIDYIKNAIAKDGRFRSELKGIVIGQFTIKEYKTYCPLAKDLNRRMMNMLEQRVLGHRKDLE